MGSAVHTRDLFTIKSTLDPLAEEHRILTNKMLKYGITTRDMDQLIKLLGDMIVAVKQIRAEAGCQNPSIPHSS